MADEKPTSASGARAPLPAAEIKDAAHAAAPEAIAFLQELIRTPSPSGDEAAIVALIEQRMRALGFEETRIDPFGNVMGRIGRGRRTLAFDAHIDTVDIGDRRLWQVDPFGAEIADGVIYGRGASDQKAGMAALVYAGSLIRRLAVARDLTVWIVGSVLEEDCDGLCWHYILSEGILAPDWVVLTEPTDLEVYRGQRGRMEIEVTTRGVACHGSAPERGVNAIHRMAPIITGIERLNDRLPLDAFLGRGSVTTTQVRSTAPSLCAVADSCTIHLDRRLTAGETDASALGEVEAVVRAAAGAAIPAAEGVAPACGATEAENPASARGGAVEITVPVFARPSHTGLLYPMRQYYPAWVLPESHELVAQARAVRTAVLGDPGRGGTWTFSTNGVATMGMHGVPTIGFGPASELHAHAPTDQCPVDHIPRAMAFYVALAALLGGV